MCVSCDVSTVRSRRAGTDHASVRPDVQSGEAGPDLDGGFSVLAFEELASPRDTWLCCVPAKPEADRARARISLGPAGCEQVQSGACRRSHRTYLSGSSVASVVLPDATTSLVDAIGRPLVEGSER